MDGADRQVRFMQRVVLTESGLGIWAGLAPQGLVLSAQSGSVHTYPFPWFHPGTETEMRHNCILGAERVCLLDLRGAGWARAPQHIFPVLVYSVRGIADEKEPSSRPFQDSNFPFFFQLTSHYCVFPWPLPVLEPLGGYGQKSALGFLGGQGLLNSGGYQNHLGTFVKPQGPHPSLLQGAQGSVVSMIPG